MLLDCLILLRVEDLERKFDEGLIFKLKLNLIKFLELEDFAEELLFLV